MTLAGKGNDESVNKAINSPKKSGPSFSGVGARSEKSLDAAKGSAKGGKPFSGIGSRSEESLNKASKPVKKGSQDLDGFKPSRSDKVTGKDNGKKM
jgi:hypothetical protein